jgi:hypothetical protein
MLNLVGFRQISERAFEFIFDRKINTVHAIFKQNVPESLAITTSEFFTGQERNLESKAERVELNIPASIDSAVNEYSIIMVLEVNQDRLTRLMRSVGLPVQCADAETHYLEIVRQSPRWLKSTFNFDSFNGYTILGRRSINAGVRIGPEDQQPIVFNETPHIVSIVNKNNDPLPAAIGEIPELLIACKIIRLLWDGEMQDSPTDKSYSEFLQLTFEEKLQLIHNGEFPVSCQGMRDMFLHAALGFKHFQVRAVDAHNYTPQFGNLISYAHATAEVYVDGLSKWVLTDPWAGFALTNMQGEYMSAEQLVDYDGQFIIIPLIERIVQSHMGSSGAVSRITRRPIEAKLNTYEFGEGGHFPNYKTYFCQLKYAFAKLKDYEHDTH